MRALPTGLLLLLVGCAPAWSQERTNPHGSPTDCASCHEPTKPGTLPEQMVFNGGNPNDTCRKCHDDDPHQVDLVPDRTHPDPEMLLFNGKVACFTCHKDPACTGKPLVALDPYFFRGGPYQSQGELCGRCHALSGVTRFNPHKAMAEGDRGEVCLHCHLETPDPEDASADLKITGPNICLGCHRENVHAGSKLHLTQLGPNMVRRAEAAGLPVGDGDMVICVTCHDPHPSLVKSRTQDRARRTGLTIFAPGWQEEVMDEATADREERLGTSIKPVTVESDYVRLPLSDGELCMACHEAASTEALRRAER